MAAGDNSLNSLYLLYTAEVTKAAFMWTTL
jgi:hypothetical protein